MYSSYKKTNVKFALHPFHFLFNHIQTDSSTLQVWKAGTGSVPHPFSNPDAYPFRGSRLALKRALTRPRSAPRRALKRGSTRTGARLDAHLKPIRSPERASTRPWSLQRRAPEAFLANSLTWARLDKTLKLTPKRPEGRPDAHLKRAATRTWSFLGQFAHLSAPQHDPEARPDAHLKRAATPTGARLDAHLKRS